MTPWLTVTVDGVPAPQGSKRARPIYRGKGTGRVFTGRVALVEMAKGLRAWRADVEAAARRAMAEAGHTAVLDCPLAVQMTFTLGPRPTRRPAWWPAGARWSRSAWWPPASKPDLSKLVRATEDALTGVAWADDARVVHITAAKAYAGDPNTPDALGAPGAVIRIWPWKG